ncbi:hypothetical protein ACV56Z_07000 [Staphylococcus aureus]
MTKKLNLHLHNVKRWYEKTNNGFEGVVPNISRRFHESPSEYTREMMSKYMTESTL